jgi:hypothetical protein
VKSRLGAVVAAAAVLIGSLVGCAGVTASEAQYIDATATIWVVGHDKVPYRLIVEFIASVGQAPPLSGLSTTPFSYLVVSSSRCPRKKCGPATTYQQSLVDNQYDVGNLSALWAHSGAYGKGVTVTWKGTGPSMPLDTTPNVGAAGADLSTSWPTKATLTGFGATCIDATSTVIRHTRLTPAALTTPVGVTPPFTTARNLPPIPVKCTTAPGR